MLILDYFAVHSQGSRRFQLKRDDFQTGRFTVEAENDSSFCFSADRSSGEARSFLRGIDVNRLPSAADCEEEAAVSSPNSTISSLSGKRSERETNYEDLIADNERASSRGISDEEDGDASRKKLRLSRDQSAILEESFKEQNTLNPVSMI